jgi:hypothetical protein
MEAGSLIHVAEGDDMAYSYLVFFYFRVEPSFSRTGLFLAPAEM